jgi:hypothetical protein
MQGRLTDRTGWSLLPGCSAPGSARTLLGRILNQLGFQAAYPLVDFLLDFPQRGFRVASSPLSHVGQYVFAQFSPMLFGALLHLCLRFLMPLSYPFLLSLSIPLQKCDAHSLTETELLLASPLFTSECMQRLVDPDRANSRRASVTLLTPCRA